MSNSTPSLSANELTARLLIEIPKRFPRARVWRSNTGAGIGMSTVKKAVEQIRRGETTGAIKTLLSRPIKWGVVGGGDISGVFPMLCTNALRKNDGLRVYALRCELEVKAEGDRQSQDQKNFEAMIDAAGGIYIVARSVEQCLADLEEWV